jgi:hypothetical protein
MRMVEQKSSKSEDGRGIPAAGEQKTAEATKGDFRLLPGGSPGAARLHVGMNAIDKDAMWIDDVVVPGVKSTF